jgi:glycosyltransferase involved in cell wall biosynthesis
MTYQKSYSSRKRRGAVLMIGAFPPPLTGAALINKRIADQLRQFGHVKIVNVSPIDLDRNWRYHFTRLSRMCLAFGLLIRHSREFNTMYISLSGGLGQAYDLVLVAVARIFGYALFIHHHSFSYVNKHTLVFALIGKIAGYRARHICLCTHMATKLKATYGSVNQTITLSNAALVGSPCRRQSLRRDVIVLGHMSNLMPEKGIDTTFDVLRRCRSAGVSARLLIAGPVLDASVQNMVESARAEFGPTFEYRGAVHGKDKERFFQDIDIFLFPTRYHNEAQPLVVLEALAAGVPVIASARGCIGEAIGSAGLTIGEKDDFVAQALATLSDYAKSPDALMQASRRATARAKANFKQSSKDLQKINQQLVG